MTAHAYAFIFLVPHLLYTKKYYYVYLLFKIFFKQYIKETN